MKDILRRRYTSSFIEGYMMHCELMSMMKREDMVHCGLTMRIYNVLSAATMNTIMIFVGFLVQSRTSVSVADFLSLAKSRIWNES